MTPREGNDVRHLVAPAVAWGSKTSMTVPYLSREKFSDTSLTGYVPKALPGVCVASLSGAGSWANQTHGGGCRRERTSEQLFIRAAKIFRGSAWSCGRSGLTTRSAASQSARNAPSGTRVFSLTASASRTPARCTRSMVRSSTIDGLLAGGMQMSATGGAINRRPAHPMDTISGGPIGPSIDRSAA